ncbi:HTH_Tnp_Tc3_2 domain-containing protein [Trichonephila clavipes]|nr:HTH_Tnp_Tc3_2 domain-containing protein [Trichonephila clavipes]
MDDFCTKTMLTTLSVEQFLTSKNINMMGHPPYSPDLAPCGNDITECRKIVKSSGTQARKPGSGETRKTTRREDRRMVRQALVDPTVNRSTIRADVGVAIVPQTISRHLAEAIFKSKRPFRALPLTTEHW